MKKIIFLFVVFITQINYAQSVFPINGENVGIGTTSPLAKLEVNNGNILVRNVLSNTDNESSIMIAHSINFNNYDTFGTSIRTITQSAGNNTYGMQFFTQESFLKGQTEKIRIQGNGNVGIGTTDPAYKLDVFGPGHFRVPDDQSGLGGLTIDTNSGTTLKFGGNVTYSWIQSHMSLPLYINELGNNTILNVKWGNVGIGTPNPDSKLAVNGTIHSKEVKVDMSGWPDYVFKKEYNLPTLEEVEKHITEKGHLENIPSEEEVLKNGVNLGEMDAKLLQKIEELTLYVIEQEKKNEIQSKEIDSLKKENKNYQSILERVIKLENQSK